MIYPLNYGYLPGTIAEDGEEIDAYLVGEFKPL
ncbi:inorganic diphosphatase [Caproicibacter fermentans]